MRWELREFARGDAWVTICPNGIGDHLYRIQEDSLQLTRIYELLYRGCLIVQFTPGCC
jgi:hypothetical protein